MGQAQESAALTRSRAPVTEEVLRSIQLVITTIKKKTPLHKFKMFFFWLSLLDNAILR